MIDPGPLVQEATGLPALVTAALQAPFPRGCGRARDEIVAGLEHAIDGARQGAMADETHGVFRARQGLELVGPSDRFAAEEWISVVMGTLVHEGVLYRGAELIGNVFGLDGSVLKVTTDRLEFNGDCAALDPAIAVSVEVDGQVVHSSRPTLTRMAAGAVLPGSALLVGLAAAKPTTQDWRTAAIVLAHPDWTLVHEFHPDEVFEVKAIAMRLAAVIDGLGAEQQARTPATPASSADDRVHTLERIDALRASGALTSDQAAQLTSDVLAT